MSDTSNANKVEATKTPRAKRTNQQLPTTSAELNFPIPPVHITHLPQPPPLYHHSVPHLQYHPLPEPPSTDLINLITHTEKQSLELLVALGRLESHLGL